MTNIKIYDYFYLTFYLNLKDINIPKKYFL